MTSDQALRSHLIKLLDWGDAHADFDQVVSGVPTDQQGLKPAGLPYSLWQLLEHIRLAQFDILDFCRNPKYKPGKFPDDYWPRTSAPPTPDAWEKSAAAIRADRQSLIEFIEDPQLNLFAEIEHGDGQTYLREVLLVADHGAYHLGEMVALRRILGIWR